MTTKREFTGVFIPAHIWVSTELIPAEKMILGEIDALSKTRGYCDASRAHFAEWLGCTVQNVSYYFSKLESLGFVTIEKTPGERSKIRVCAERFYQEAGVNGTDGGGKWDFRVGVNGTDGGGKRDLPEIKDKIKEERKGESARAGVEASTVEENPNKKGLLPAAAAPQKPAPADHALTYDQRPYPRDADELKERMRSYFTANPNEWHHKVIKNSKTNFWTAEKFDSAVTAFCLHIQKTSDLSRTYNEYVAALTTWFIRQKEYDARDAEKPNAASSQGGVTYKRLQN